MEIIKGKIPGAKKVVVYGPEGIGKSTFASMFPDPLFMDTNAQQLDDAHGTGNGGQTHTRPVQDTGH